MDAKELAKMLNGRAYGYEITEGEAQLAKENGLVVVFGYSDDCVEFRGAIDDEVDCYESGIVCIYEGTVYAPMARDYRNTCPFVKTGTKNARTVNAVWHNDGNPCWTYQTDIPHHTFNIYEDADLYCVGIVFELDGCKGETDAELSHEPRARKEMTPMVGKKSVSMCPSSEYCRGWNDAVRAMREWANEEEGRQ